MKVLFAVSNENISEAIVKQYQQEYKEILSYKNVYYFNAILKELQKDKSYDRIVISEDLEPFANNNFDTIDKFLFEKLDNISDEATDAEGNDTPIIIICTDRRTKADAMLVKLFGIGIYSALLGQDRSIEEVCQLINKPRTKKDAKQYYKIESDDVNYQPENESDVSETEIQNILAHYKRLGKNTERYVDSFNNIVTQYTDSQLKVIIKFLPLNVKAVLEAESPKYQELVTFSQGNKKIKHTAPKYNPPSFNKEYSKQSKKEENDVKFEMLENISSTPKMTKPVVIPSGVSATPIKKITPEVEKEIDIPKQVVENVEKIEEVQQIEMPKKGRGRPRKIVDEVQVATETPKRGRGRPKKVVPELEKQTEEIVAEPVNLFELEEESTNQEIVTPINVTPIEETVDLFNLQEEKEEPIEENTINELEKTINNNTFNSWNRELAKDKKIISFVGTSKNGTSFIVNNLAQLFANRGIQTAILDMTSNKNAYYIYTKNEENLRKLAANCIDKLRSGVADGIKVNKNLTVYTCVPGEDKEYSDYETILTTLTQNYSIVLIDCDFNTNLGYFAASTEMYLVQSMDVLTIQPLTAFLRELKAKGVLEPEKLRVIINKEQRVKGLSAKVVIGGMAFYNDPAMSFMTELFDRNTIRYCTVPFDVQVYAKYLGGLVDCEININGYPKTFITNLNNLANMVYPLINRNPINNYQNNFSNNVNSTLNKMKKTY